MRLPFWESCFVIEIEFKFGTGAKRVCWNKVIFDTNDRNITKKVMSHQVILAHTDPIFTTGL